MKRAIVVAAAAAALLAGCQAPGAVPAPAVTVTESPALEDDPGYDTTQTFLNIAWAEQDNPQALCLEWAVNRAKWTTRFVDVAVQQSMADRDVATVAVEDFFDGKCGL